MLFNLVIEQVDGNIQNIEIFSKFDKSKRSDVLKKFFVQRCQEIYSEYNLGKISEYELYEAWEMKCFKVRADGRQIKLSIFTVEMENKTTRPVFIEEIAIQDPDTKEMVEIEIWKDKTSNGIFGVDSLFLEESSSNIPSPFNFGELFDLKTEEEYDLDISCLFPSSLDDED